MSEPVLTTIESPCRVLHILDSLGLGGAQAVLKVYLEARGADDHVQCLYALRRVPNELAIGNPNVTIDPSPLRYSLGPLRRLRRIIRDGRFRVLHCHLIRAQVFGYLAKRLFFPQIALVFHEHGRAVGIDGKSRLEAFAFRLLLRVAGRQVDCFVCISDYARDRLLELIPSANNRTTVIANPISPPADGAAQYDIDAIRSEMEIPNGAFVVGFAGRLVEGKGWRDFLAAIMLLSTRIPIFFLLAGDGSDREAVVNFIDACGLRHRGRLLGYIQQMSRFYRMLDCLAMPSHWEAHGLSHLEAQSYGVPVVISDVPGLNATVHANQDALLFRSGDATALAEQIFRIASNPALRARLSSGGMVNAARFGVDAFTRSLDTLYAAFSDTRPKVRAED